MPDRRSGSSPSGDDAPLRTVHGNAGRRRSAGIYGTIVASAVIAAGGSHLRAAPLAIAVLVTLLVYWAAEGYAELLGEHVHAGRLPTRPEVRASLVAIWPMVTASYVPLASLLAARVLGADTATAATVALLVAIALLLLHGWMGRQGVPAARPAPARRDAHRRRLRGHDDRAQAARHPLRPRWEITRNR